MRPTVAIRCHFVDTFYARPTIVCRRRRILCPSIQEECHDPVRIQKEFVHISIRNECRANRILDIDIFVEPLLLCWGEHMVWFRQQSIRWWLNCRRRQVQRIAYSMLCPHTTRMDSRWETNLGRAYAPLPNRRDKGIVAARHSLDIVESMNAPVGQPLYSHWSLFWCHHLNFDDTFKWEEVCFKILYQNTWTVDTNFNILNIQYRVVSNHNCRAVCSVHKQVLDTTITTVAITAVAVCRIWSIHMLICLCAHYFMDSCMCVWEWKEENKLKIIYQVCAIIYVQYFILFVVINRNVWRFWATHPFGFNWRKQKLVIKLYNRLLNAKRKRIKWAKSYFWCSMQGNAMATNWRLVHHSIWCVVDLVRWWLVDLFNGIWLTFSSFVLFFALFRRMRTLSRYFVQWWKNLKFALETFAHEKQNSFNDLLKTRYT